MKSKGERILEVKEERRNWLHKSCKEKGHYRGIWKFCTGCWLGEGSAEYVAKIAAIEAEEGK